jgi:hypothetical protein
MKRLWILVLVILFSLSIVSAELYESDVGYKRQIYFPGYIQVDDLTYYDTCVSDNSVSNSVLVVSEVGEAEGYYDERYYEAVYSEGGEVVEWKEYMSYLKEQCSDYDTCYDISTDIEARTISGEEFYYVYAYCEYGCVKTNQGDYCLSSSELNEALDGVTDDNYGLGCNEQDSGKDILTPTTTLHKKVLTSFEFTDTCNDNQLREACCDCEEGNKKGGKVWVKNSECSNGCVYNRNGADFCADDSWDECSTDSQCNSFYDCVDGECIETVTELVRDVDDSDLVESCSYFGCDCDGDGSIEDSFLYSTGDSVSALAGSLCNAAPGTEVRGNTAWCDKSPGVWYPRAPSVEEECYVGAEEEDVVSRPIRRAVEFGFFDRMFSKFRSIF